MNVKPEYPPPSHADRTRLLSTPPPPSAGIVPPWCCKGYISEQLKSTKSNRSPKKLFSPPPPYLVYMYPRIVYKYVQCRYAIIAHMHIQQNTPVCACVFRWRCKYVCVLFIYTRVVRCVLFYMSDLIHCHINYVT